MSISVLRILFLSLCTVGGYAVSQVRPDLLDAGWMWTLIGLGFGGVLIAIDESLKGFSLRAFSAATFGLILGTVIAWMIDRSQLFIYVDEQTLWLIRLCLFIGFGYLGMVLAMRSNKEDFSLIIPYIRFTSQNRPDNLLILDTSAIIDGRVADLIEANFLDGVIVVPRFVLMELQRIADSSDPIRRARGRRGLDVLSKVQRNLRNEVKVHEGDIPEEEAVDAKLVRLARTLGGKLYTSDYNLGKIAELQSVPYVNISELAAALKRIVLPGETFSLRLAREGKDKGQAVGYLNDGTMVVVNEAEKRIGEQVPVRVLSVLQTGAGIIVFAEIENGAGGPAGPVDSSSR